MASKYFLFACLRSESWSDLPPKPHYPSMPKYPRGSSPSPETAAEGSGFKSKALFSVVGMTCSACAGSVEKAIKRLDGIRDAVVDVLNGRAQVIYYSSLVDAIDYASQLSSIPCAGY